MPAVFFSLLPTCDGNRILYPHIDRRMDRPRIRAYRPRLELLLDSAGCPDGGTDAASEHLKQVRWHLDLSRRTDGSFAYDGREQFGPGTTADNTYLGCSRLRRLTANAMYLLTYSMPLKRLWITGKNANPAYTLDSTKIANAVAAGSYSLWSAPKPSPNSSQPSATMIPSSATTPPKNSPRSLSGTDLTNLRNLLSSPVPICARVPARLSVLSRIPRFAHHRRNVEDKDIWVRAKAAKAIGSYQFTQTQADSHLLPMLNSFINHATDPNVIDWNDPIQMSNGKLSFALFPNGSDGYDVGNYAIDATKPSPLYDAIRIGLRQPDSYLRLGVIRYVKYRLAAADAQALYPEIVATVKYESPADRMWGPDCRGEAISFMTAINMTEGIPFALAMLEEEGYGSGAGAFHTQALNGIASYGDAARYTLPILKGSLKLPYVDTATAQRHRHDRKRCRRTRTGSRALRCRPPGRHHHRRKSDHSRRGLSARGSVFFPQCNPARTWRSQRHRAKSNIYPARRLHRPGPIHFSNSGRAHHFRHRNVAIVVGPSGNGIKGEYFNNANFTNSVLTRTDGQINFDWGAGSPHASISPDTFSVRWNGILLVPETADYTFSALASDGVRLYLNGKRVIDRIADQNSRWTDSASIRLTAGQKVNMIMECYKNTGNAVAKLKWRGPQFAGRNGDFIPQSYLYTAIAPRR